MDKLDEDVKARTNNNYTTYQLSVRTANVRPEFDEFASANIAKFSNNNIGILFSYLTLRVVFFLFNKQIKSTNIERVVGK